MRLAFSPWSLVAALAVGGLVGPAGADTSPSTPACPQTSTPTVWTGTSLDTGTTRSGTLYNGPGADLELNHAGSVFNAKQISVNSTMVYAAVGDFNKDGWPDFVGASENSSSGYLDVFQNYTWQNENCTTAACTAYSGTAPNWLDPSYVVTPKFVDVLALHSSGFNGRYALAATDFNGDGWDDVLEIQAPASGYQMSTVNLYLNKAANDSQNRPTFSSPTHPITGISNFLGTQSWSGTNIVAVDWNGDGYMDILVGNGAQGGSIRILKGSCSKSSTAVRNAAGLWPCTSALTFTDQGNLIANLSTNHTPSTADGFGTNASGGLPVFAYADVDGDGKRDLIVGAPNCCSTAAYRLRLFKGVSATAVESVASQSLTSNGAITGVFVADYSEDGKPDLIVATDGHNYSSSLNGGTTFYYLNNGTNTPFAGGIQQQITFRGSPNTDYDVGFIFDYDRDPTHSPDLMVADGNDSAGYYVIADRQSTTYVDCGEAASGVIDLGSLLSTEMVVTAARITPSFVLNGGTISFYLSNEDPPNWVQAALCPGSTTDYCAAFPRAVGRSVRWKAVMCSSPTHTSTPRLTGLSARYDYTLSRDHYRSGIVVSDGIGYVGAFDQPGDRGRFYAINAGLDTVLWDGAAKLDGMDDATRNLYTAFGTAPETRIDFTRAQAGDPQLQGLLTTPNTQATQDLISWVRSARFGIGNSSIPLTRLGAVETSTPSVLTRPGRPTWYSFASGIDRSHVDLFVASNANRVPLVLFGSKDGMVHALYTFPANQSDARNGREAWAYIPAPVAAGMLADYNATQSANQAATDGLNHPSISSFPDGSPTLVDYQTPGGTFKTAALIAHGNGGRSFSVIDVTKTVDPTTGSVSGPIPMWSATPGLGEAGQAYGKPAVIRVLLGGAERYLVVTGTGVDYSDTQDLKGRTVSAYDLLTGTLMWKFQARCPVTSDVSSFETDDAGEPGAPTLNGFIDRVVFADKCGYVYKLDPAIDLSGNWYQNTGMGSLPVNTTPDGKTEYALFSTRLTSGALGADRPIAGTIAARTDSTTRMVLLFGTGGIESVPASSANAFFAVYADTGAVRSRALGACSNGVCEKFYGGVVVTPEQVIFTKTVDPQIGTNACDSGSSTIAGVDLNPGIGTNFTSSFALAVNSAVMGGLFGDAGAIYFATVSGDVARIGTPRTANPGGDTAAGQQQGMGVGDQATGGQTVGTTSGFTLMGWRAVL
ncbi:MAG TPA: FG-GAP-like repeat-containing protein [Kofleriaceae bacterium]|nr:FG-GAP-like repeat-containing protein [Kofleriaceae bacterium]